MPFAVTFVELFFIFKGIWSNQYTYFIVGFLVIVFLILVVTAAEISIVVVYLQLQAEVDGLTLGIIPILYFLTLITSVACRTTGGTGERFLYQRHRESISSCEEKKRAFPAILFASRGVDTCFHGLGTQFSITSIAWR
jgi:hypothetical protein